MRHQTIPDVGTVHRQTSQVTWIHLAWCSGHKMGPLSSGSLPVLSWTLWILFLLTLVSWSLQLLPEPPLATSPSVTHVHCMMDHVRSCEESNWIMWGHVRNQIGSCIMWGHVRNQIGSCEVIWGIKLDHVRSCDQSNWIVRSCEKSTWIMWGHVTNQIGSCDITWPIKLDHMSSPLVDHVRSCDQSYAQGMIPQK